MAKHKQGDGGGGAPAWMTTYGDMVTLLLCFFVLLFSMSSINQEKFQKIMEYFTGQGEYMTDFMPGGEALVGGELIINGTVQLDNIEAVLDGGRDALNSSNADAEEEAEPEDMEMTDAERQELQKLKTAREMAETIQVEGHTDNRPINTGFYKSNRYLSAARAIAVEEELVNIHGFIPQKVSSTGYGEFHPIDTNSTPEGQAHNRRVEIKLLLSAEEKFLEERDIRSQGQMGKTAENK